MSKDVEKRGRQGAFVITDRDDDKPMFDFALRVPGQPAPPDQIKLAADITKFISNVDRSGIPLKRQNEFIELAKNIFFKGCVREALETAGASRELAILEKSLLVDDLLPRVSKGKNRELIILSIAVALLLICYVVIKSGIFKNPQISLIVVGSYFLVAIGSVLGLIVANRSRATFVDVSDILATEAQIRTPLVNILGAIVISFIVAIAVQAGLFSLKIGNMDTNSIDTDWKVAVLIGFIAGMLNTDIVTIVFSSAKKRLARNDFSIESASGSSRERR